MTSQQITLILDFSSAVHPGMVTGSTAEDSSRWPHSCVLQSGLSAQSMRYVCVCVCVCLSVCVPVCVYA